MVETVTAMGIVISAMPMGEYDKRVVLLTKQFGKITAFARGARRPTSQFLSGTQPMSFGEFYHVSWKKFIHYNKCKSDRIFWR